MQLGGRAGGRAGTGARSRASGQVARGRTNSAGRTPVGVTHNLSPGGRGVFSTRFATCCGGARGSPIVLRAHT
jgi:hypothetical protein